MLRDQEVHWPWYDARREAVRRIPGRLDAQQLHRRMLDVLAQPKNYGDAVAAAFEGDARADLSGVRAPVLVLTSDDPRDRWAEAAAGLGHAVEIAPRPADPGGRATLFRRFLDRT